MVKKIWLLLIAVMALNGCTRDDICSETTPTTPLLIITFKDINDPTVSKSAENLTIATLDDPAIAVLSSTTTDSISLPLRTTADITEYNFILDDVDEESANPDLVQFSYTRENIYVNRACAYKVVYNDFDAQVENEGSENWIIDLQTLNTTIEDVETTHLTIFH